MNLNLKEHIVVSAMIGYDNRWWFWSEYCYKEVNWKQN